MRIREYNYADLESLISLWHGSFGDERELVEAFFSRLGDMGTCLVAENEAGITGMASIITGCELIGSEGTSRKCAYIYAVAVDEALRSMGIGRALVSACAERSRQLGTEIICTLPAENWLYSFYERYLGTSFVLHREKRSVSAAEAMKLSPVSVENYLEDREGLLSGKPHMRPSLSLLSAQNDMCRLLGGGLFGFDGGVCCGYIDGRRLKLGEILCRDERDLGKAAAAAAFILDADRADYCVPAGSEGERYMTFSSQVDEHTVWNICLD